MNTQHRGDQDRLEFCTTDDVVAPTQGDETGFEREWIREDAVAL